MDGMGRWAACTTEWAGVSGAGNLTAAAPEAETEEEAEKRSLRLLFNCHGCSVLQ